jgi:hypothetical protein
MGRTFSTIRKGKETGQNRLEKDTTATHNKNSAKRDTPSQTQPARGQRKTSSSPSAGHPAGARAEHRESPRANGYN